MRRIISVLLAISILFTFYSFTLPVNASTNTSIEEFAEDMSELYAEEIEEGKELEESVTCRVIVKATTKPDTYKNAECVVGNNNRYIYQYSDAETAQKAVEYYNGLSCVKWAELDGIVEGQAMSYGNYMIQGDEAKEYVSANNIPIKDVVVAVLDSGANFDASIYDGRVIDSGYNLSDTGKENSAMADHTHGNRVTGIIVDNTPKNVTFVAYKTLNSSGLGTNSSLALGIELAVDDGADIINISSTSNSFSNAVYEAVKYAYSKDVIIVCAAGNDGDDVSNYYPAAFEEVFTVGSIDRKGNYSFFSNHGEEVDFVAPGHNIEVTSYVKDYGTSFSAPFVSAAAATVLSINPDLKIDEVKDILIDASVPYKELSYHDGFHVIEDYEQDEESSPQKMFVEEFIDDETLYYGYGMPQIQNAVGITLGYEDAIKPEISVESGTYHEAFEVTISAPEGYEIYYTTDETYPTKNSAIKYSSPIKIQSTQSIRTVAFSPDGMKSSHNTAEYRVLYFADERDFEIDSNGYIISYNGNLKEFIVPETINGTTVTGINEDGLSYDKIISIVLPETLTHIEDFGIKSYNAIYISAKGLKSVGDCGVFCPNVVEFDAPNLESVVSMALGVRKIEFLHLSEMGRSAFASFHHLEYVNLPLITNIPCYAFSNCYVLKEISCPQVTSIDFGAFSNCYWLKTTDFPKVEKLLASRTRNDSGTFKYCLNLTEVYFPNLTTIEGFSLFEKCYGLTKIDLPKAESICENAFKDCILLSEVDLPSVQFVEDYAFSGTKSLTQITLENTKEIGNKVFENAGIEKLDTPELISLGKYAFSNYDYMYDTYFVNETLFSINAPKLEIASDYAFAYTGALTKLELPSLTDLGENAFYESSVSHFDAPKLQNTSSLPTAENSISILSSEFSECSLDATGYDLTIYGTPDTYAQTYAEQNGLTFINAPAIINDLPSEYFEGKLTVDVAGFDKIYRWFGTNNENGTGVKLLSTSTTEKELDPSDYNYKYYFCIIISRDNKYNRSVKTSMCQNMLYSSTPSSDARITIATPSNRYLKYGESINLYANATGLPEGAKIKWRIVEGGGVTLEPSVSGKICTVTSKSNGNVTIEAYAVNKNGNTIVNEKGNRVYDREGITSEVGLWWIILYYIRQIFSMMNVTIN